MRFSDRLTSPKFFLHCHCSVELRLNTRDVRDSGSEPHTTLVDSFSCKVTIGRPAAGIAALDVIGRLPGEAESTLRQTLGLLCQSDRPVRLFIAITATSTIPLGVLWWIDFLRKHASGIRQVCIYASDNTVKISAAILQHLILGTVVVTVFDEKCVWDAWLQTAIDQSPGL